ncbi:MAG TPA: heme lyase CcmF/NrfE family subunit [Alphaproteobacteria bacterium]|nr:heme lyase CcmF/NrfE family subunit [Alphaproteobacteria bacterium]
MIAELGQFFLIMSLAMAIVQAGGFLRIAQANKQANNLWSLAFNHMVPRAVRLHFLFLGLSFGILIYLHIITDLSVLNVADNSSAEQPLFFRISGAWGNHEGSLLLWIFLFSLFSFTISLKIVRLPEYFRITTLACQGLIAAFFLIFIILSSNPFERLSPPPFQGAALNPLLQDPALALHPPTLYMGYVGFSIAFSFAIAGMLHQKIDREWANWLRPWVLISWVFLTVGIGAGSHWAYYELGWGGWWFWDAVENASLLPWLTGTALIHSLRVLAKRDGFKNWTVLLAITSFSLCLLGTFLVRSGLVISVHSFATDPWRGIFILVILGLTIGGAFTIFAKYGGGFFNNIYFNSVSRETGILFNNLLLLTAMGTVLIGTLYPVILEAIGARTVAVGPPYYDQTFVPIFIPLLILMAFIPFIPWRAGHWLKTIKNLMPVCAISLIISFIIFWLKPGSIISILTFTGGILIVLSALWWLGMRLIRDFASITLNEYAMILAHIGLGITVISMAGHAAWKSEIVETLSIGDQLSLGNYRLVVEEEKDIKGPNFTGEKITLGLFQGTQKIANLYPEKRYFPSQQMFTAEAAIFATLRYDLYAAIAQENFNHPSWKIWFYINPLMTWLWLGVVLMAIGGLVGLIASIKHLRHTPSTTPSVIETKAL